MPPTCALDVGEKDYVTSLLMPLSLFVLVLCCVRAATLCSCGRVV
jgi:hypothetical protein